MEVTAAELIKRKNYVTKVKKFEKYATLTDNSLLGDALEDLWKGKTNVVWDTIDSNIQDDELILEIINRYSEDTLEPRKRMENYDNKRKELLEYSNPAVASKLRSVFEDLPLHKSNILWDMVDSNVSNDLLIVQALSMYRDDATKLKDKIEKYITKKAEFLALADSTENLDLKNALEVLSLKKHNILWEMLYSDFPDRILIFHIIEMYHDSIFKDERKGKVN